MKKCPNCGVSQENDAMFCDACGRPFPAPKRKLSVFCLAGFICTFVATLAAGCLAFCWLILFDPSNSPRLFDVAYVSFYVALAGTIVGFILSVVGVVRSVNKKQKGTAFGIVAIVEFVINIIVIAIFACLFTLLQMFLWGLGSG